MGFTYHFLKKNEKKNCGNCGNAIAENGRKKKSLRQWHCRNRGYKFLAIVTMVLPKMGGKKKVTKYVKE